MKRSDELVWLDTMSSKSIGLCALENGRLVRAIDAALRVSQREDFQAWICGEFRTLLPFESLVCLEIDRQGQPLLLESLQKSPDEARCASWHQCAAHDLAWRLVRSRPGRLATTRLLEAGEIQAALADEAGNANVEPGLTRNALIHRIRFLSGEHYFLVLFNLPPLLLPRCVYLCKLLSAHTKMALSCVVAGEKRKTQVPLTRREFEILCEMKAGKSNREISAALGISPITLKNHVSRLYRKLDVQNRADAVSSGLHQAASRLPSGPIEPVA